MDERERQAHVEGALTFARIAELQLDPVKGNYDAEHLKEVHRRIFQDLPHHGPGQYRPPAPAHIKTRSLESQAYRYQVPYAPHKDIDSGLRRVLDAFGGPDSLKGLNADQFSARVADLYADLDYLHPFREGNSRTLRAFTSQMAQDAGHTLDWGATNANAGSRDRLYIARDKDVLVRAYPGIDEAKAMSTNDIMEYEAYALVLAPFAQADSLRDIIKHSAYREADLAAAAAFRGLPPDEAKQHHPQLAGSYGQLNEIENRARKAGLDDDQTKVVRERAKENIAAAIERGEGPKPTGTGRPSVRVVYKAVPSNDSAAEDESQDKGGPDV